MVEPVNPMCELLFQMLLFLDYTVVALHFFSISVLRISPYIIPKPFCKWVYFYSTPFNCRPYIICNQTTELSNWENWMRAEHFDARMIVWCCGQCPIWYSRKVFNFTKWRRVRCSIWWWLDVIRIWSIFRVKMSKLGVNLHSFSC